MGASTYLGQPSSLGSTPLVLAALAAVLTACGRGTPAPAPPPSPPAPVQLLAVDRLGPAGARTALAPVTLGAGAPADLWARCSGPRAGVHARAGGRTIHGDCAHQAAYLFEATLVGSQVQVALRPRAGGAALATLSGAVTLVVVDGASAAVGGDGGTQTAADREPPLRVTIDGTQVDLSAAALDSLSRDRHPRLGAPLASLLRLLAVPTARRVELRGDDGSRTTLEAATFSPRRGRWAAIKRNRRGQVRVALVDDNQVERSLPTVVGLDIVTR